GRYGVVRPLGRHRELDPAPESHCVAGLSGDLPNLPNPEAVTFRDSYVAMHGSNPTNYMSALAYAQLWSYADAINQAGTTDQAAVIEAMESMTFDSPMGQWSFGPSEIT